MSRERDRGPNARKQFNLLLNSEERVLVQAAADADRRALGAWIRKVAVDAAIALKKKKNLDGGR